MVRREKRHTPNVIDVCTFAYAAEPTCPGRFGGCLRTMAREAFAGLELAMDADPMGSPAAAPSAVAKHPATDQTDRATDTPHACGAMKRARRLPKVRELFPLPLSAIDPLPFRSRAARTALREAARRVVDGYVRAQEAFAQSQKYAMQADAVVAEVQIVLDILSPGDPQHTRASQKRHAAMTQAREATMRADDCYRAVRERRVEPWIRYLTRLPECPTSSAVSRSPQLKATSGASDAQGNHARAMKRARHDRRFAWRSPATGGRRIAVPRLVFIPATRLADRRLTRYRVSEGGRTMTHTATPFETEDGRVTSAIWDAVVAGASLKDIHGIPSETMDGLYAHAYDFYSNGQLAQAEAFFRFLCIYDFYNPEYIVGLAAVCQLKEEYQKAIDLYAMAFAVGKSDYRPVFYAGQCQMMTRNVALARECFALVCESSCDADLRTKAKAYLDAIDGDSAGRKVPDDKEAA